jgi:NADPH:quinone reductase-like Zn-dependent oxidoreductase
VEAYRIDRFGSVDGIVLRSSEDPRPGLREILMRVRASSLNYRDLMVLKGGGRGPTKLGVVPLSDGAGEVAAVGEGVTRVKVGDRIAGTFHPRWFGGPMRPEYLTDRLGANLDGMLAEYAVLSEEALVHVPGHLSFEEAATLPCAAVTAWVALTGHRKVTAGDTVLTLGSGGVSVFALQFARVLYRLPVLPRCGRVDEQGYHVWGDGRCRHISFAANRERPSCGAWHDTRAGVSASGF